MVTKDGSGSSPDSKESIIFDGTSVYPLLTVPAIIFAAEPTTRSNSPRRK